MPYELLPSKEDGLLFFRLDGEAAERYGSIGYLRADFGRDGRGFWATWFDQQPHLKTPAFKDEFDEIINSLRDGGQKPPFASRDNLAAFCAATPGKELTTRGSGYMIQTLDFSYYIRCLPRPGDYDIYAFAFDNRYLLPELAGKHDLPDVCYSVLPSTGELISISRYEKGYSRCDGSKPNPEENRFFADTSNKIFGITRAQEEAMLAGSMFGWDVPAAKPWKYDKDGKPLPPSQKKMGRSDEQNPCLKYGESEEKPMTQAERFIKLTALTRGSHNNDPSSYHAAFYLLSHDPEVCAAACRFISVDGISFTGLKRAIRDFDERTRQVVDIAHNLFSWRSPCKATPFDISRLGYPYMELICNACYIAAGEFQVIIEPDKAEITLDNSHYKESKRIYQQFKQMERAIAADMAQDRAALPKSKPPKDYER
ncbi:conserved hypothetical protein [uncultured Eubacteriales bacterium]|uniref:Uncharacterized protein n=1 Tax=uncultured Eubacteriales bacterium TaxID=172733 RepID=A0A212JMY3_9FIRM|nr:conserved hypothetical protein [uncultured Eubacteriales bacterium]